MNTSTSPVASSAFTVPMGRGRTLPSIRTTHSARTCSAALKAGLSGSATTWVMP